MCVVCVRTHTAHTHTNGTTISLSQACTHPLAQPPHEEPIKSFIASSSPILSSSLPLSSSSTYAPIISFATKLRSLVSHSYSTNPFGCLNFFIWSHIVSLTNIDPDDVAHRLPTASNSRLLYCLVSLLSRKQYVGQTCNGTARMSSHYNQIKLLINGSLPSKSTQRVHRFFSKFPLHTTFFFPLLLVSANDALFLEQACIKHINTAALNTDIYPTRHIPFIHSSISSKPKTCTNAAKVARNRNHKHQKAASRHPLRLTHHQLPFSPTLFALSSTPHILFARLFPVFDSCTTSCLNLRVFPGSKLLTNLHALKQLFGSSPISFPHPHPTTTPIAPTTLSTLTKCLFLLPSKPFTLSITLVLSSSPTQCLLLSLSNKPDQQILSNLLANSSPTRLFQLYKLASRLDPLACRRTRFAIRQYGWNNFRLTTKNFNSDLSFNISFPFHHSFSNHWLTRLHRTLISCHCHDPHASSLASRAYITFLKCKSPADLLLSHRQFAQSFNRHITPPCAHFCSDNRNHTAIFPSSLPPNAQAVLRNTKQPLIPSNSFSLLHLYHTFLSLTLKFANLNICSTSTTPHIVIDLSCSSNPTFSFPSPAFPTFSSTTTAHYPLPTLYPIINFRSSHENCANPDCLPFLNISLSFFSDTNYNNFIDSNILIQLHNKIKIDHLLFSHPLTHPPSLDSFSSSTPGDQLLGSMGDPFLYQWDARVMLATPPPSLHPAHLTAWIDLSLSSSDSLATIILFSASSPTHHDNNWHFLSNSPHLISTFMITSHAILFPQPPHLPPLDPNVSFPQTLLVFSNNPHDDHTTCSLKNTLSSFLIPLPLPPPQRTYTFHHPHLTINNYPWLSSISLRTTIEARQQQLQPPDHNLPQPVHALRWLLILQLKHNNIPPITINNILSQLSHSFPHTSDNNNHDNLSPTISNLICHTLDLQQQYSDGIFTETDHNPARCAILCPKLYHHGLTTTYFDNQPHFLELTPGMTLGSTTLSTDLHTDITNYIRNNLNPSWFPLTWKSKPQTLPYLYNTVKDDLRWRPIGSYSKVTHKRILSIAASALHAILKLTPKYTSQVLWSTHDFLPFINAVNNYAQLHHLYIYALCHDVKNFFLTIPHDHARARVKFMTDCYQQTHHTSFVSIPKYKSQRKQYPPTTGKHSDSTSYYHIHTDFILQVLLFAQLTAIFTLGNHFLQQVSGLPMGDPLSPPTSICFAAYDEYHSKLSSFTYCLPTSSPQDRVFCKRYLDDRTTILCTTCPNSSLFDLILQFIESNIYEHDLPTKNMIIKPTDLNFLQFTIIIYNNNKNIRLVYNNKNHDIINSNFQNHGRFYHKHAPSPFATKLNAIINIINTAFISCTFPSDSILPILSILYEASLLSYSQQDLQKIITACFKKNPNPIWLTIAQIVESDQLLAACRLFSSK